MQLTKILTLETKNLPITGFIETVFQIPTSGSIFIYGDSNCFDSLSLHQGNQCLQIVNDVFQFFEYGSKIIEKSFKNVRLPYDYQAEEQEFSYESGIEKYSKVLKIDWKSVNGSRFC